jgi:hypothetical protein
MSSFWIIYLASAAIVGCALMMIGWHDRHEFEGGSTSYLQLITSALALTFIPILNAIVIFAAVSHVVAHHLQRRSERLRQGTPQHPKVMPDTLSLLDRYSCECSCSKSDPRFPDQTSKPDLENKTGI